jgi:hypothetical protein
MFARSICSNADENPARDGVQNIQPRGVCPRLTIVDTLRRPPGLAFPEIAIGVDMKYPYDYILAVAFLFGALFCIATLAVG